MDSTQTQMSYKMSPTIYSRRAELGQKLKEILGSNNVYYQAPENTKLKYPCILYELSGSAPTYADNKVYTSMRRYDVTVITRDPDSPIFTNIEMNMPYARFDRQIISDGLYHRYFTIYY